MRGESGLTLIELLITMTIAVVLSGMVLITWFALQSSFTHQARANEARDTARDAMARVVREVRDAASPGTAAVVAASGDSMSFYTTFNDPGATDSGFGNLRLTTFEYDVDADGVGRILRYRDLYGTPGDKSDDRVMVIANHVQKESGHTIFTYWYFDAAGKPQKAASVPTSRLPYVHTVEVRMVVDQNADKPPSAVRLHSVAQIRNARPL